MSEATTYERACERAAQIIGSEYHNPGVIEAALDWQAQQIMERDAQVAALREALDKVLRLSMPSDVSGYAWVKEAREALAATPAGALDALKREVMKPWREAVEWMSGSDDFAPGGKAHEGWVKVRNALLAEARHE